MTEFIMKKILIILSAVVLICVSSVIILCSRYPKTDKFENFDDLSFKEICLIAEDYAEKHLDGSCKLYGITANDVKKDKGIFEFIYTDRIGLFRHAYFVSVDLYSKKITCSAQWNAKRLYGRDIILEPQSWNFELYKIDEMYYLNNTIEYDYSKIHTVGDDTAVIEYYQSNNKIYTVNYNVKTGKAVSKY